MASDTASDAIRETRRKTLRERTIEDEVRAITQRMIWVKPEVAMEILGKAYVWQRRRYTKRLLEKEPKGG